MGMIRQNVTACFAVSMLLLSWDAGAADGGKAPIPLWPKGVPGKAATSKPEADTSAPAGGLVAGKPVVRLGNVREPSLTVYPGAQERNTGTGIIVFPGGGYGILAFDLEGTEVCAWLNSIGVTAFLLKYRVPQPAGVPRYAQPLQDAERAISIVRARAADWGVRADRVGVLGFSAGGHLAALLGSQSGERTYPRVDQADQGTVRPNFTVLVYPAYLSVRDEGRQLAPELPISAETPPTFIVQAEDDHHFIEGTLLYYRALERAKVPAEMHLFSHGGHGYGLRPTKDAVTRWPGLAQGWLQSTGWLNR